MSARGVFLFMAAGVLAVWLFVFPTEVYSQPVFVVETVDAGGDVGKYTSIALDTGSARSDVI